jgi:hypothetical protein
MYTRRVNSASTDRGGSASYNNARDSLWKLGLAGTTARLRFQPGGLYIPLLGCIQPGTLPSKSMSQ